MRLPDPRPYTRTLRRLLLLALMLTVAALAAARTGNGKQQPLEGAAPQTWAHLRNPGDTSGGDNGHPSSDSEAIASPRPDKVDQEGAGRVDCKSRSAGDGTGPCGAQSDKAKGGRKSWLRHYMRAAKYFRRHHGEAAASSGVKGGVCLKEEMKTRFNPQRMRSLENHCGTLGESPSELGEEIAGISKRFCTSGSVLILKTSLSTFSLDLYGMLHIKIQCAPTYWSTDYIRSLGGDDGKKCYSWNANKNLMTFLDIIRKYVSNRKGKKVFCSRHDNSNVPDSDFAASVGPISKSNITMSFPEVVKGIKCRYDLVEGQVNDIAKKKVGCKKKCRTIAGRIICPCRASELNDDTPVRHCRQLDPNAESDCSQGYDLDTDTMVCVDINECETDNGGCAQECDNTNGGFRCRCRDGFFLMEDQKSCDTRDECAIGEDGRSLAGCAYKCTNLASGFMCTCPEGFKLKSEQITSCVSLSGDITITQEGMFFSNATIPTTEGKCPKGFSLDDNRVTCTDIDECAVNISGCTHTCENLFGGFRCKCHPGYYMLRDAKSCKDFDECRYHFVSRCDDECENTEGSYRCRCRPGFLLQEDQKSCEDIDECRDNTAGCSQHCENLPGSYKCSCFYGYYLMDDQKTCQDIDECRFNLSGCAQECENTAGSFRCKCLQGYALVEDGRTCRDIDECRRNTSGCAHHCENTLGSYKCSCRPGYFLMQDGRLCDTVDECAPDRYGRINRPCSHQCVNMPTGFLCVCPTGYVMTRRLPGLCVKRPADTIITSRTRLQGADLSRKATTVR